MDDGWVSRMQVFEFDTQKQAAVEEPESADGQDGWVSLIGKY
jgi:hypothetical protein